MNNLMDISVIKTNDGWMVKLNEEYVLDKNGDNIWDNVVDAIAALQNELGIRKEFYKVYGARV